MAAGRPAASVGAADEESERARAGVGSTTTVGVFPAGGDVGVAATSAAFDPCGFAPGAGAGGAPSVTAGRDRVCVTPKVTPAAVTAAATIATPIANAIVRPVPAVDPVLGGMADGATEGAGDGTRGGADRGAGAAGASEASGAGRGCAGWTRTARWGSTVIPGGNTGRPPPASSDGGAARRVPLGGRQPGAPLRAQASAASSASASVLSEPSSIVRLPVSRPAIGG